MKFITKKMTGVLVGAFVLTSCTKQTGPQEMNSPLSSSVDSVTQMSVSNQTLKNTATTNVAVSTSTSTSDGGFIPGSPTTTPDSGVVSAPLVGLAISPNNASVPKGLSQDFKLFGFYADGSTKLVTTQIQWVLPVSGIATISASGQAVGTKVGSTPVMARVGSFTSSAILTVTESPIQAVVSVPGPIGPQGPQGIQGAQGIQGIAGVNGRDGTMILSGEEIPKEGEGKENDFYFDKNTGWLLRKIDGAWQSVTNLIGSQGNKGEQGEQGEKGDKGEQGERGERGEQGLQGERGFQGSNGKSGNSILAGFMMPLPDDGNEEDLFFKQDTGEVYKKKEGAWEFISSLMGQKGEKGDHGDQGQQGVQGLQGMQGLQGEQGVQGLQGIQGDQGRQGEQGIQGERGEQGIQGVQGERGQQGIQGIGTGILAEPATSCVNDSNGGTKFTTFNDLNNNGKLDPNETVNSISVVCGGLAGRDGRDGRDGTSSKITVNVASLVQCSAGGYLYTIDNGDSNAPRTIPVCNGERGMQGLQGATGAAGASGSSVTPVKFCSSDPSVFPEYGLKVGDDIFAVWWGPAPYTSSKTAFLAKLVPGSYSSTGGNGCNFTLNSNGSIMPGLTAYLH